MLWKLNLPYENENFKNCEWSYQDLLDRVSIQPVIKGGDHVQNQGSQQGEASVQVH